MKDGYRLLFEYFDENGYQSWEERRDDLEDAIVDSAEAITMHGKGLATIFNRENGHVAAVVSLPARVNRIGDPE